jgi:hypothetical protein
LGSKYREAYYLEVTESRSGVALNEGGKFRFCPFPFRAQWSSINDFLVADLNGDGRSDLLAGGNKVFQEATFGPVDASAGLVLLNVGDGSFEVAPPHRAGIDNPYSLSQFIKLQLPDFCDAIVCFNANGPLKAYKKTVSIVP